MQLRATQDALRGCRDYKLARVEEAGWTSWVDEVTAGESGRRRLDGARRRIQCPLSLLEAGWLAK
jgi:hypothetical protein